MGRVLAILALVVECAIDITGIVAGLIYPDRRLVIPGAGFRLVIVVLLATLALRGKTWARFILAVLVGSTAIVGVVLLFVAVRNGEPARIMLRLAGIALGYALVGAALGVGLRPRRVESAIARVAGNL